MKRLLDRQVVTHQSAGEFLHLMKTLMAKLRVRVVSWKTRTSRVLLTREHLQANDWGAVSRKNVLLSVWLEYITCFDCRNYGVSSCTADFDAPC